MPGTAPPSHQFALIAELIVLFVLLPIAFRYKPFPFPPIPALWLLTAYCLFRLLHDPAFDREKLWNSAALPASAAHILIAFAVVALLVAAEVYFLAPHRLFNFVRRAPGFWALVMCLYPVVSVYPQGIIYRAFFFERYRGLFPNSVALIVASAVAFSFAHIIFRNPIALAFTLAGGLLFAWRYAETGSLFTSAFEHALYGCWMFTIGLGEYFYKGARGILPRGVAEILVKELQILALTMAAASVVFGGPAQVQTYLGFDRNDYPGAANLAALRQTFSYAGYWLNNPPGEKTNTWTGHRAAVENAGFGFLVLFNGRLYAELKSVANATRLGESDANAAVTAARREGFPRATIIFLDQEQGGRMLPEQKAYIYAWVDGVAAAGFRAGVYCSGVLDDNHVITAVDIRENAGKSARATPASAREITYWVTNDACPPAPGCTFPKSPPSPAQSGVNFAEVWQFAQSPRRKDVAVRCTNYSRDGNCYPPGAPAGLHVDLNAATSADPSHGGTR